jgi:hypothetical protein
LDSASNSSEAGDSHCEEGLSSIISTDAYLNANACESAQSCGTPTRLRIAQFPACESRLRAASHSLFITSLEIIGMAKNPPDHWKSRSRESLIHETAERSIDPGGRIAEQPISLPITRRTHPPLDLSIAVASNQRQNGLDRSSGMKTK